MYQISSSCQYFFRFRCTSSGAPIVKSVRRVFAPATTSQHSSWDYTYRATIIPWYPEYQFSEKNLKYRNSMPFTVCMDLNRVSCSRSMYTTARTFVITIIQYIHTSDQYPTQLYSQSYGVRLSHVLCYMKPSRWVRGYLSRSLYSMHVQDDS